MYIYIYILRKENSQGMNENEQSRIKHWGGYFQGPCRVSFIIPYVAKERRKIPGEKPELQRKQKEVVVFFFLGEGEFDKRLEVII